MEDSPIVVDYFEIAPDDIPIALHKGEVHALSILFTILFHITPFFVNFLSTISSVHVSNGVNEALSYPKWKEAA